MSEEPQNRRAEGGRFLPGQSGNPGGRPKAVREVEEMARQHTPAAVAALVRVMESDESPAAARVSAACALLDRGWGKPRQEVEHSGAIDTVPSDQRRARIAALVAKMKGGEG